MKDDKTGLIHCQPKFEQTKNGLLIQEEQEKKEIDKKVLKYIYDKNNFVV